MFINIDDLDIIDSDVIIGIENEEESDDTIDKQKLLCEYDSDWSEIEDLLEGSKPE